MISKNRTFRITIGIVLMTLSISSGANAATYTVCEDGCEFSTIQDAIDDTNTIEGDTIEVQIGDYYETIVINKQLNLIGVETNGVKPRIIGTDTDLQSAVKIETDGVNFQGFTINNDYGGIYYGIDIESENNNIRNNEISGFYDGRGILIYYPYNTISDNVIRDNDIGIEISSSNNNDLSDNIIINNYMGIYLSNSNSNTLKTNTITNNGNIGIYLDNSGTNDLIGNVIHSNDAGISLISSSENTVKDNIIWGNNGYGIDLSYMYEGINSDNNKIYNNYFHNNENARESYTGTFVGNIWNLPPQPGTNIVGGALLSGNYWSDYNGEDTSDPLDGLGDETYNANLQNGDEHPLIPLPGFLKVHNVDQDTYFLQIQEAIEDAYTEEYDTIEVSPETFREHVSVIIPLTLVGIGTANTDTIIDGGNFGNVVEIQASETSIENFKITGSGSGWFDAGIGIEEYIDFVNIKNNFITSNQRGIACWYCSVNIESNDFNNNRNDAIYIVGNDGGGGIANNPSTIADNLIRENSGHGIVIYPNEDTIRENIINQNADGISLQGGGGALISQNRIYDNRINGITIMGSNYNEISGSNEIFSNDNYGIYFQSESSGNGISDNRIYENRDGIVSYDVAYANDIKDNTIDNNIENGIRLDRSRYFEIHNNFIRNNILYGIRFQSDSLDNQIYNNYFENSNNVYLEDPNVQENIWQHPASPQPGPNIVGGPSIGGNFWANPAGDGYSETCVDESPQDGFCDDDLDLDLSNSDYMPLAPVPEASTFALVGIGLFGLMYMGRRDR